MFNLQNLVRPNIQKLEPYSCARDEFTGDAQIFLDANENSFGSPVQIGLPVELNRYPDTYQGNLRQKIAEYRGVDEENVFLGVGSDEIIELLIKIFCEPGKDNIIINPPTFGMYEVAAKINNIEIQKISLTEEFQIDLKQVLSSLNNQSKIIFLCSPNNPTGNLMKKEDMKNICKNFSGIVVVDEAYIDFADSKDSMTDQIMNIPNLVILQTFSKAWGLAGIRLGVAIASPNIIQLLMKIKAPYNINSLTSYVALQAFDMTDMIKKNIANTIEERQKLRHELDGIKIIEKVFPSDANFLLVLAGDSKRVYEELIRRGIIVRFRKKTEVYDDCLRITVGTAEESKSLINALKELS